MPSDPIPNSGGGGSGAIYVWNTNTQKILAEEESIHFGRKGLLEFKGVDSTENACLIEIRMPGTEEIAVAIAKVGDLEVLTSEQGTLIFGVTALTNDPDYCSVVVRYDSNADQTEPPRPIDEEREDYPNDEIIAETIEEEQESIL